MARKPHLKPRLTILSLLLIVTQACNPVSRDGNGTAPANTAGSTNEQAAMAARNDVISAMNSLTGVRAYRMDTTLTSHNGTRSRRIVEYAAPDRFRVSFNGMELIIVGQQSFIKKNSGWEVFPTDMSKLLAWTRSAAVSDIMEAGSDFRILDQQMLDGKPTRVYQYNLSKILGAEVKAVSKLWVGIDNNLPYRIETDVKGMPQSSKTIQIYEYDTNIVIAAPK